LETTLAHPRHLGLRLPAEWAPHEATWTAWPHGEEQWEGLLEPVREEFALFVNTLARSEKVHLVVADEESLRDAQRRLEGPIEFHLIPHNDLWLRDSGPLFVAQGTQLALVKWKFNGWGGKYPFELDDQLPYHIADDLGACLFEGNIVLEGGSIEVNGLGLGLTTRQCLLAPNRNPELSEEDLEEYLAEYLGISHTLWLAQGLQGDHTDGHVDNLARFVDPTTLVAVRALDSGDPNYRALEENLEILRSLGGFRIVELPLPEPQSDHGVPLPRSYANFYIANRLVLVPTFGVPQDEQALEILRPLFPGREVVGLPARLLITGGGAFHCVTQPQPQGVFLPCA
jgi:agmatine deiminase